MTLPQPTWLERVRGDFDSVRLLDYDALCDLSISFAPGNDPDGHWLFFRKRDPEAGTGYVLMPVPEPVLFEDDDALVAHALRMAQETYTDRVARERALLAAARKEAEGGGER